MHAFMYIQENGCAHKTVEVYQRKNTAGLVSLETASSSISDSAIPAQWATMNINTDNV